MYRTEMFLRAGALRNGLDENKNRGESLCALSSGNFGFEWLCRSFEGFKVVGSTELMEIVFISIIFLNSPP